MTRTALAALLALASAPDVLAQQAVADVGRFSSASPVPAAPWQVIRLDDDVPPTVYRTVRWDGVEAIEARAEASMALLARPLEVDLQRTPVLCWRWRVERVVESADMTTKRGDDYAARVYVAFGLPANSMNWGTRMKLALARGVYGSHVPDAAVNYVWDNRHPVGTRRRSAYTDRAQMIVLRSGSRGAGVWVTERRDVLDDVIQAFGTERARADLLAVAADTDNTGERARSGFADLHFVGPASACEFDGQAAAEQPASAADR